MAGKRTAQIHATKVGADENGTYLRKKTVMLVDTSIQ